MGEHVRGLHGQQKMHSVQHCRDRGLVVGQKVWVRNMHGVSTWLPGVIEEVLGLCSYLVRVRDGELWCRNIAHLRDGSVQPREHRQPNEQGVDIPSPDNLPIATPTEYPMHALTRRTGNSSAS